MSLHLLPDGNTLISRIRAGEGAFSSNCWEEYQQLKDEFTSSSLTNQIQDNEPQDVDFDNTVD
jgi:hypothetical protein